MNKIKVVNDNLEKANVSKYVQVEYYRKECLFAINDLKINVTKDSELDIEVDLFFSDSLDKSNIDFSKNEIIDETALNTMTSLSGKGYEEYMKEYFGSTPMVLIMKDNKIINAHTGYTEYDSFKTIFDDIDL